MRALVISGGGSKGAFAGGVAQFLMQECKYNYDIFVGTSTGSLLVSHLALGKIQEIKHVYTSVNQESIFSSNPFTITTDKFGNKQVKINHWSVLKSFIRGKKTFGESVALRQLIFDNFSIEEFNQLKNESKDVVVTVSNLTKNRVEYKELKKCTYVDFCEWIWASANFVPFMTLYEKNNCEYADGGFGNMVPIEEAIRLGAKIIDVIVLETQHEIHLKQKPKNVFSLITDISHFMANKVERQNIQIGKLLARNKNVLLNFYYTPTVLTTNPLIFEKNAMTEWWQHGYNYAQQRNSNSNELRHHLDEID